MKVGIVMGSMSDDHVMAGAEEILKEFGVEYEKRILSAHRTPHELERWIQASSERGVRVYIAGAGGAAHLAGVVAAFTTRPVIAVPVKSPAMHGLDSLLAMVQMPSGIPVATVAIDGSKNAALLAIQMMGIADETLNEKMIDFRRRQAEKVVAQNPEID